MVIRDMRGWTEDGVAAMQANPAYFDWWERVKTGALLATLAVLALKLSRRTW